MPQFDKITFLNQIIWLFFFFSSVYFLTLKIFLPRIAFVLKLREKKLTKGAAISENAPLEIKQNQSNLNLIWGTNLSLFKDIQFFFKNHFSTWLFSTKNSLISLAFLEKKIYHFFFMNLLITSFMNSIQSLSTFDFKFKFLKKIQINNSTFKI